MRQLSILNSMCVMTRQVALTTTTLVKPLPKPSSPLGFLESDFDIGEKNILCKVKLSASQSCKKRLTVGLDNEGRWKISNFTRHVKENHMKNSTNSRKSGLNMIKFPTHGLSEYRPIDLFVLVHSFHVIRNVIVFLRLKLKYSTGIQ